MDPIMMAARRFADGVCAFLRSKRSRTLRSVSVPEDHNSVIGVLRLIERAPDNLKAVLANDVRSLLATSRSDDGLLLAAAGAELAEGNRDGARTGYVAAARFAERTGNTSGAARAWRAVGALAKQDGLNEAARIAFARASTTS
jgi:hypothetical protein